MNQLVYKIDESIVKLYEGDSLVPTIYEGSYIVEDDTSFRYLICTGSTIVSKVPYEDMEYIIETTPSEA